MTALEIPLSLFLWTIAAYGSSHVIGMVVFHAPRHCSELSGKIAVENCFEAQKTGKDWLHTLEKVFLAGIVVTAIFLGEKTIVQIISIDYHRKQFDAKIKESKKLIWLLDLLYDASRQIFPEFCREFEEEDDAIQGNNLQEVRNHLAKAGVGKALNNMGRARDKVTAAFGAMVRN